MHNQAQLWGEARTRERIKGLDQMAQWKALWIKMIKEIQDYYDGEVEKMQSHLNANIQMTKDPAQIAMIAFKKETRNHWTSELNVDQMSMEHILNAATPV